MLANKKIVIFDMDGTLIDSVGIWNEVDRKLSERLGRFQRNSCRRGGNECCGNSAEGRIHIWNTVVF